MLRRRERRCSKTSRGAPTGKIFVQPQLESVPSTQAACSESTRAHGISIARLTPDYCASTGASSGFLARNVEACTFFKRADTCYALFDSCCCFCPQRAGGRSPLYVWTGNRWGSRLDGIKGHDFQIWSAPLDFRQNGTIAPLRWINEWSFEMEA